MIMTPHGGPVCIPEPPLHSEASWHVDSLYNVWGNAEVSKYEYMKKKSQIIHNINNKQT